MAPTQRNPKNLLKNKKDGSKNTRNGTQTPGGNGLPGNKGSAGKPGGKGGNFFNGGGGFTSNFLTIVIIFLLLMSAYTLVATDVKSKPVIPLSQLANDIKAGDVSSVRVTDSDLTVTYTNGAEKTSMKDANTSLPEQLVPYGVTPAQLSAVNLTIATDTGFSYWFFTLAPILLPALLLAVLFWFLARQVRGAGMQAFTFGQSKARMIDPADTNSRVTFADVAGAKEAKEELVEIVDFLKNPKKFLDIGARIPKGILLMGPPGTGKTMLARAIAGEAGVPFFTISGSEFVEMFVGVGASRVRDLFQVAKRSSPAIIFVDEIDAVGRTRGSGVGGGNDEREQTLNQILVEMDGFEPTEKLIVVSATNRPDVLDPALLRPGRFDRRVTIDLPDRKDREEILAVHARKKPFGPDVNLKLIAERTPGFSGAELYSLMNEAAILAARESRKEITQFDLIRSIEKVMLGPERKSHLLSRKEKRITAYHEAGHALVASVLPNADPVHKVSIISRGSAGGYTLKLPFEDKKMPSKNEFIDDLATMLGGYAAEMLIFNDVTTGPSNDLSVATNLAKNMVSRYGMSDAIGPAAFASDRGGFGPEYSQDLAARMDAEVGRMIEQGRDKATEVITTHRAALDAIADALVDVETLERDDFEKILIVNGITPKKKEDYTDATTVVG